MLVKQLKDHQLKPLNLEDKFDRVLRKAQLLNNHLLIENNTQIAHIAYDDGKLTYALAMSNPNCSYVGVLNTLEEVEAALNKYKLSNIDYIKGEDFNLAKREKYDAIIVADILYRIYNYSSYSKNGIPDFLSRCFSQLKSGGQIVIRDYAVSKPDDVVLLELPSYQGRTEDINRLQDFVGSGLIEIDSNKTYTRLFQLSYKTAYDFILGKDNPDFEGLKSWQLVAYSTEGYQKLIEGFEGRVLYMSGHRDEAYIKTMFHERFKIYSEEGVDYGYPATSYFIVAQKQQQNESLYLFEKEKLDKKPQNLSISAVVDEQSGSLFEVVRNYSAYSDIVPYRITLEGKLNIFLTESTPHGIANTITSKDHNLDNRQWSGHMIDAVKLETEEVKIYKEQGEHEVRQLIYDQHRIVTACGSELEVGPALYPAPDYIDELRECYYIQVCKNYDCSECLNVIKNSHAHSRSLPQLKELDAQKVLNSIRVGLIPSSILETQIIYLMDKLSIAPDKETEKNIPLDRADPKRKLGKRELMSFLSNKESRFKETRERTGKLDIVRSRFVDEGKVGDALIDISSGEEEFIAFNEQTNNTALVVPLTRDLGGEILAGFEAKFLPVPERFSGSSASIAAPTFPLPKDITNYDLAKEYIAKQFKVKPDRVGKLGESYFTQIDMTAHRIYPFVVATAAYDREGWGGSGGEDGFTAYSPLEEIWKLIYWDNTKSFMTISARLMTRWCQDSDISMGKKFNKSLVAEKISNINNASEISKTTYINRNNLDY